VDERAARPVIDGSLPLGGSSPPPQRDTPSMAHRATSDRLGPLADPPSRVHITVVPGPRARPDGERLKVVGIGLGAPMVVVLTAIAVAVVAMAAIVVATSSYGGRVRGTSERRPAGITARTPRVDTAAAEKVATAYAYPLGCPGLMLSGGTPAGVIARLTRTNACWRHGVYVTAILRKAHGRWRVMLKATSPKCVEVPLSDVVRSDRVICRRIFPAVRNIP
jgi:hypothetical protein